MRARPLEPLCLQDQLELTQGYKTSRDVRLVRRCHAVLLVGEGKPVPEVAALLRVHQSTVHRWLDRFEADGVAGLGIQWGAGRAPRWDEAYEADLLELVRHSPRWSGVERSVWTCPLLADTLAERRAIRLSAERVRGLLHQHGIRLKQPTATPPRGRDPFHHPKACGLSTCA